MEINESVAVSYSIQKSAKKYLEKWKKWLRKSCLREPGLNITGLNMVYKVGHFQIVKLSRNAWRLWQKC